MCGHHGVQCLPDPVQGCIPQCPSQGNADLEHSFPAFLSLTGSYVACDSMRPP